MEISSIKDELILLANEELDKIKQGLPQDTIACLGLFVESVRVLDFIMLGQPGVSKSEKISFSVFDLNMIELGWNLATSILLKGGKCHGFPMRQSTHEFRKFTIGLLYQLGIIVQIKRTVDMINAGLVNVTKNGSTYTFSHAPEAKDQFLDELAFGALEKLEEKLQSSGSSYKSWELVDRKDIIDRFSRAGNFLAVKGNSDFASYKLNDIDQQMIPLIKQWDSGEYGIMMGYDSTPEIDNHFLAIASELIAEWRDEAGFSPNIKIGNIPSAAILVVGIFITSFHLKHIHFAQLTAKKDPAILIPQSLSIWNPSNELVNNIADFSGIDPGIVEEAIHSLTLKPDDTNFLEKYTTRFRPLLIDFGSGFLFRPISSVIRNPLHSVLAMIESRDPSLTDRFAFGREEWIRQYLYALFAGSRYQRVEGNIKIREGGLILTDIDAAIYDNLTGELALFQIKWQNFYTNDVNKLRSRAKNFVGEINRWTEKIELWLSKNDISFLVKSLQLKGATGKLTKSSIYLFGLGKNTARTRGYGYELNNKRIAIGTWAQFILNRTEIGPAPLVFSQLFLKLKEEESSKIKSKPLPVEIPFSNVTLSFKDIWSIVND